MMDRQILRVAFVTNPSLTAQARRGTTLLIGRVLPTSCRLHHVSVYHMRGHL
jgi:hypothetical protein